MKPSLAFAKNTAGCVALTSLLVTGVFFGAWAMVPLIVGGVAIMIVLMAQQEALREAVRTMLAESDAIEKKLNDPKGDGSGDDPQSPTGDDYNELWCSMSRLRIFFHTND